MVPSVTVSDRVVIAQLLYTVSVIDQDLLIRPTFKISSVYTVFVNYTTGERNVTRASSFWVDAFTIGPTSGILTSFGKLNAKLVQEVILTIEADDSMWYPPRYDFKNITVIITNGYVARILVCPIRHL